MAESLLRAGTQIVIGAPMASQLRALAGRTGVRGLVTSEAPAEQEFSALLDPGDGPVVLVIDDGELWRELFCYTTDRAASSTSCSAPWGWGWAGSPPAPPSS
jgi:S-DNA-T family DNA segregation ATPase FtsK/SpoIIIE